LLARYRELCPKVAASLGVESQAANLPTDESAREDARSRLKNARPPN
jgi:hypothetical protein